MFICNHHKSKRVTWQGMTAVVGHFDALDLKRKYGTEVKIEPAYPTAKKPKANLPGPCVSVPVSEYLLGLH